MTALYLLAYEYRAAADKLADLELDEQTIVDTLEGMSGELEVKATATAAVVRNMQSLADQIKEAEGQMAARRKSLEGRAKRLTAYLLENMQHAGITKIDSPHFSLSVRNNPASVDVFDEAQLPGEFLRQPAPPLPTPDKVALKEALKAGIDVPGARLVHGTSLQIK